MIELICVSLTLALVVFLLIAMILMVIKFFD